MTQSISCRIMDALADLLQGTAPEGASTFHGWSGTPATAAHSCFWMPPAWQGLVMGW